MTPVVLALLLLAPQAGALEERIAAAPPEIAAFLYLKHLPQDKARQRETVELAFAAAARARQPYAVVPGGQRSELDARRYEAGLEHLDRLGLQARAVRAMFRLDPRRALQMAREIPPPEAPAPACGAHLVPRFNEYYGMALQVAQAGFSRAERADGRALEFLLHVLSTARSAPQLADAATMAGLYEATPAEREALDGALAAAISLMPAVPSDFDSGLAAVNQLDGWVNQRRSVLLSGVWKSFMDRQLAVASCKDGEAARLWVEGGGEAVERQIQALGPRPSGDDGDWQSRFMAAVRGVEAWQRERMIDPAAHFHAKASAYRQLLDLGARDSALESAIAAFIRFLHEAPAKEDAPAEWLMYFRRATLPLAPAGMESVNIAKREIRRSGDALMNLLLDAGETY